MLHDKAVKILDELHMGSSEQYPFSVKDIDGVLHSVYLHAYDVQCDAAARHAVALASGKGVRRRRSATAT
jgi:hypothetical protein